MTRVNALLDTNIYLAFYRFTPVEVEELRNPVLDHSEFCGYPASKIVSENSLLGIGIRDFGAMKWPFIAENGLVLGLLEYF